ncbi:hypothetical protein [Marinomonas posidonica]|uniref:Uncharacterized protein n=1 Tax=Marinomonas posidonica (strain CECT 7376 / NCIMB 14433 / IVIA-Po-181) TaxID=491952 RepID=F6CZT8_MARPP|nr:hypothetical protein [Marinomonas posidonica]AEF53599.1 hypothetical protein Mar181_0539 [Marinomonas posidonica IVIA-Po-181]
MMKLSLTLLGILTGSSVIANDRGFDLELGPYMSYMDYSEHDEVSQYGVLTGLHARYSSYYSFSVLFIDVSYASDQISQKGAGKIESVKNEVYDLRSMIGRALYVNDSYRITPYLGLGYRRSLLDSRGQVSTTLIEGYKSQQVYFYNPIGIEFQELVSEASWVLGARIEYDIVLLARNETRLSASEGYRAIETDLSNARGYHFYLQLQRFLNPDGGAIVIEPFYKYWQAKDADETGLAANTADHSSNEWGVSLLLSF